MIYNNDLREIEQQSFPRCGETGIKRDCAPAVGIRSTPPRRNARSHCSARRDRWSPHPAPRLSRPESYLFRQSFACEAHCYCCSSCFSLSGIVFLFISAIVRRSSLKRAFTSLLPGGRGMASDGGKGSRSNILRIV